MNLGGFSNRRKTSYIICGDITEAELTNDHER